MSNLRKEVNSLRISRTGTEYTRPTGTTERYETDTPYENGTEAGGAGQQGAESMPSNERDAYQMAYNDFLRGEYAMAIEGFRNYLASYPQGNNRENARYYLAEALFNQGDFEGAVEEYDTFILNHPDSPLLVNAKYKKALSFLESNQTPSGVILLRQIINQYPESNESRLASEKLRSLGLNP
jgi:tol-pal system protein YbgF